MFDERLKTVSYRKEGELMRRKAFDVMSDLGYFPPKSLLALEMMVLAIGRQVLR